MSAHDRQQTERNDALRTLDRPYLVERRTVSDHERGIDSWEKNHRKGWITGTLAFALCGAAFILAGIFTAAETDGVYPEQTQAEGKSEKNEKRLIQKIEAD